MKYLLLFCFILSAGLVSSQASNYNLDKEIEKVFVKYQMEDSQKSQVKTLFTQKYNDLMLIKEMRISTDERNKKKLELKQTYDEAFVGLLTEKQKQLHRMYQQLGNPRPVLKSNSTMPDGIKGAPNSKPQMEKANQ